MSGEIRQPAPRARRGERAKGGVRVGGGVKGKRRGGENIRNGIEKAGSKIGREQILHQFSPGG